MSDGPEFEEEVKKFEGNLELFLDLGKVGHVNRATDLEFVGLLK